MKDSIYCKTENLLKEPTSVFLIMKKQLSLLLLLQLSMTGISFAQNTEKVNGINNNMPNRISMNVTVAKQTQGATFGEKVNQGLHAAGGALAQGASLLGASLPGGSIISAALYNVDGGKPEWEVKNQGNGFSLPGNLETGVYQLTIVVASGTGANDTLRTKIGLGILTGEKGGTYAVSSVGNLAGGAGGGAAAASYAKTGKPGGENIYSIFINGVEYALVKVKTKHDTVKNSINNVR